MKKIKFYLVEGLILNVLALFVIISATRGIKVFGKDLINTFNNTIHYFKNINVTSIIIIAAILLFVAYLVYAIVIKITKKRNVFGPLYLAIVVFIIGLTIANQHVFKSLLDNTLVVTKTAGIYVWLVYIVSNLFLLTYGVIETKELIDYQNKTRKEKTVEKIKAKKAKIEKKNLLAQRKEILQKAKEEKEALKASKQKELEKQNDFEVIHADENKEEVKKLEEPLKEPTKEEVSNETKIDVKNKEIKEEKDVENTVSEEKKEEKTTEEIDVVTPVNEEQKEEIIEETNAIVEEKEVEEGYQLTKEGYLPNDEGKKVENFKEEFAAKEKELKDLYSELKNELLSFSKVKNQVNKGCETFKVGRNCLARISTYEKGFKLYLACDPYTVDQNTYYQYDADVKYPDTPLAVKVHSKASCIRAQQLITLACANFSIARNKTYQKVDYSDLNTIVVEQIEK